MTWKQQQKRIDNLRKHLAQEVGSSTMDLINELVELELQLEKECNK